MPEELVRLSKRISELGIASRREADAWIEKGWVKVNGEIAVLGMKVRSSDRIQISSKAKAQQDKLVTVVLNKPIGYVSGQAEDGYEPAKVLVTAQNRWEKDDSPLRFHPSQLAHLVPAALTLIPLAFLSSLKTVVLPKASSVRTVRLKKNTLFV